MLLQQVVQQQSPRLEHDLELAQLLRLASLPQSRLAPVLERVLVARLAVAPIEESWTPMRLETRRCPWQRRRQTPPLRLPQQQVAEVAASSPSASTAVQGQSPRSDRASSRLWRPPSARNRSVALSSQSLPWWRRVAGCDCRPIAQRRASQRPSRVRSPPDRPIWAWFDRTAPRPTSTSQCCCEWPPSAPPCRRRPRDQSRLCRCDCSSAPSDRRAASRRPYATRQLPCSPATPTQRSNPRLRP